MSGSTNAITKMILFIVLKNIRKVGFKSYFDRLYEISSAQLWTFWKLEKQYRNVLYASGKKCSPPSTFPLSDVHVYNNI